MENEKGGCKEGCAEGDGGDVYGAGRRGGRGAGWFGGVYVSGIWDQTDICHASNGDWNT